MKKYEEPKIEFCELVPDRAIANTCWGYHDGSNVWGEDPENIKADQLYCDIPGPGYVGFNITGGNCNFTDKTISWTYYTFNDKGEAYPAKAPSGTYEQFKNIIERAGGNKGQPFAGEGSIVKPDPSPSWS